MPKLGPVLQRNSQAHHEEHQVVSEENLDHVPLQEEVDIGQGFHPVISATAGNPPVAELAHP
ncbi:MAG: hypothetical protein M1598_01600 [Actinobacteria bacterium]|nr:hypothetical protein [Actinomycetota bacterium]